ncbi:TIGR02594 family protein [Roseateles asaccharophilus]|uniref:Uncharacterized protein (TIGR02594 family) n=1 Tax=Roseateles asaccharophilus TaxID=582607 RepID=A0ABU2A857_9BURK|nr:TIGR02594 family protein [Roseateles asaccharophilus]MDR7333386.1 uncharacterized protein (TIGR02594 family) [Roseateles asaccharophilus]
MISLNRADTARSTTHDAPPGDGPGVVVQPGDTLQRIAAEQGVPLQALIAANPQLRNPDVIYPGTRLALPEAGRHTVKPGDTLHAIAQQHGVGLQALIAANPQLRDPDRIHPGDTLRLPPRQADEVRSTGQALKALVDTLLPLYVMNPAYQKATYNTAVAIGNIVMTSRTHTHDVAVPDGHLLRGTASELLADQQRGAPLDLRRFTDPALGSDALAAIVIGSAEGTRRPDGGFTRAFGGHTDPGNAVHNRGSFSYQHAASSPADADRRQLQTLQGRLPAYEAAARAAGLNANDPRLASAYLDLYNQSPTAAARFLNQMGTLAGQPITAGSITDLRVNSFVDASTGERFRLANGGQAGSGFVNIARNQLGREPTEAQVQAVIRADQQRRTTAVESALNAQGLLAAAPAAAAPAAGGAPRWLQIARGELGTNEVRGARDNARVVEYHQTTTLRANDDETSWCSSFVNWTMEQAGVRGTDSAAARSWLNWGRAVPIDAASVRPGDVIVFPRGNNPAQGHVAIVDEVLANGRVRVVGGNQSNGEGQPDGVTESVRSLASAIGVRRAP